MATEEENQKLMRMMSLMISGMAKALHDMFGDSAFAVMSEVGKTTLELMEKEMGLKVEGKEPEDMLAAIGRIFTESMGFVDSFSVSRDGKQLIVTVHHCQGWEMTQSVLKTGVEVPFTYPIMNVCQAALIRMGHPARKQIEPIPESNGSTITFTLVD